MNFSPKGKSNNIRNIVTFTCIRRKIKYKRKRVFFSRINIFLFFAFFFLFYVTFDTHKKKEWNTLFLQPLSTSVENPKNVYRTVTDILSSCNSKMNKLKHLYAMRIIIDARVKFKNQIHNTRYLFNGEVLTIRWKPQNMLQKSFNVFPYAYKYFSL